MFVRMIVDSAISLHPCLRTSQDNTDVCFVAAWCSVVVLVVCACVSMCVQGWDTNANLLTKYTKEVANEIIRCELSLREVCDAGVYIEQSAELSSIERRSVLLWSVVAHPRNHQGHTELRRSA